ncbi:lipoprotein-releasing ABC transporter permease subunit [Aurantiacibacter gangjinensis]|uniref:ABC transporter substrate-binding protein n=1 Tax=Aurantiacibacter gangjinensis TaxID=502682 RepID=A0A0G9MUN2_9SPHN|nr:lipoprotein-releasing ABC transporter permease subunit [Aurantiacibacter gangjinensis]APE28900.1 Lipoprotein releasing system transmembrane protein LolC [Aurantiacibacter gangjinensis]KLE33028.1 ABC transporter substrate-binding protein [Aurantiacibacter gangjinensis]
MFLSPFEWSIAKRYMLPGRSEAVIALVAGISITVVALSVAMLVIVMSVMNGFRYELLDRITGLNGHAVVVAHGGRLNDWEEVLEEVRNTPGVTEASPLIEQPLLATFNGRAEGIFVRGNTDEDIAAMEPNVLQGSLDSLGTEGERNIAIGSRLRDNLGLRLGDTLVIVNPQGRPTPFGTVPRQIGYTVTAVFEIGLYDFDERYVIMPIPDAQTLLMAGDSIGMIRIHTKDPQQSREILAPLAESLQARANLVNWQEMNASLFEALQVERVAMAFALGIIVLVAAFNILSSLVMLVRSKTRDIAIMRTMGATRRSLLKIFVTTGSIVGVLGTGIGLLLGFVVLTFRQPIVTGISNLFGVELWDPSVRFLTELPARTDPVEVLWIAGMAMGLSFLATLYPSYRASNTDPVEVLRYE